MLRWGLLGTGDRLARAIAPAMRACGHDLAVVGSRSLTRAQAFAAGHGVRRARGDYAAVLDADDVDAVYVGLPNAWHERWTVAALQAGKHVLCAQPLSTDAASAGRIAAAAATAGVLLAEGVPAWFHPRTQAALELVHSGGIGQVRAVHAACGYRLADPAGFRADPAHGGALLDAGSGPVAAARWFAGAEPTGVRAIRRRWDSGVDSAVTALLGFPSGTLGSVYAAFDGGEQDRLELVGTQGCLQLDHVFLPASGSPEVTLLRDGDVVGRWATDVYQCVVAAFADAVSGARPPRPLDDSVATAEVCERIRTDAL